MFALQLIAGGLFVVALQQRTAPASQVLPDTCPRVLLTHSPGLVLAPEERGVVAAVWDSGVVVRADSFARPGGAHVVGIIASSEATTLFEAVKNSSMWRPGGLILLHAPEYSLFYVRQGGSRIAQMETYDGALSPVLADIHRRLFALPLQSPRRIAEPVDVNRWRCPATTWVP
jgi:hypothetical protein